MRAAITALVTLTFGFSAGGCSKKQSDGLPPAQAWNSESGGVQPTGPVPNSVAGGGMADPSNPHAGMDMSGVMNADGTNPHAGVDMSGGNANPHGTGGADVTAMGLEGPDPTRPLDPSHHIAGTLKITAATKAHVQPNGAVFLIAKAAGPDGKPVGPALAVDKVIWQGDQLAFQLSEANAMIANTELAGDVIVSARYDQDSDALTKEAGDVTGQARVKVPADNVEIVLDTVLTGAQ